MTGLSFDWRSADPASVDAEYSPSRFALRPMEDYLTEYRNRSRVVDAAALAAPGRPLLVYIHGGYWQMLSAADSLFVGGDAAREQVALHAVEYTLAPSASIERIIEECIVEATDALASLAPPRVVLAGSSAGAHLAAMCARDPRLAGRIDALVLLSGIYDLRPLVVTPTNLALGLDESHAAALSPLLLSAPTTVSSVLCAVGGHESGEFIRQNAKYAAHLRAAGIDVQEEVVGVRDHFDLPYDLLGRGTTVGDWTLAVLEGSGSGGER